MGSCRGTQGNRPFNIRRALAAAAALTVAGWAGLALPAAADPGSGNANGNAATPGQPNRSEGGDASKGKDKGGKGNWNGPKGNGNHGQPDHADQGDQGQGQGPQDNNGQSDGTVQDGNAGRSNGDPAGNNGTVKIAPHLEDDGIPQNTPHVTCIFDIEWYGFDEGAHIVPTVVFAMQAPTSDVGLSSTEPSQVFVGGDPASGAGTDSGFDGEATYTLGFAGEPHAQQGHHVKLTAHTPGSQGADTKHKVFWVQPCGQIPPPVVTTETGGTEEVSVSDVQAPNQQQFVDSAAEAGGMGIQATAAAADEVELLDFRVMAVEAVQADVPNAVAAGGAGSPLDPTVNPTSASALPLLILTLGLALGGAALMTRRRVLTRKRG